MADQQAVIANRERYDELVARGIQIQEQLSVVNLDLNRMRRRARDYGFDEIARTESERDELVAEMQALQRDIVAAKQAVRAAQAAPASNPNAKERMAARRREGAELFQAKARELLTGAEYQRIWDAVHEEESRREESA